MEKMAGKKMGAYLEVYTFDNKGEKKFFSDNQKLNIPIAHPYWSKYLTVFFMEKNIELRLKLRDRWVKNNQNYKYVDEPE